MEETRKFEFTGILKENSEGCPYRRLPERSTKSSAGYDFYNPKRIDIPPYKLGNNPTMIRTGIKAYMKDNEFLMLVNRSSNPKKKKLVIPNSIRYYRRRLLWEQRQ